MIDQILSYDEKIEVLKMVGLPTDPMKWTGHESMVAHEAFELARLIKKLKTANYLEEAA